MLIRIAIGFVLVCNLGGCSKQGVPKPYSFLNLRVQDQEEDIRWETINATWIDTVGNADLEATSYYFDRCRVDLKGITSLGNIHPLTLRQFYYTDGLDFRPIAISGVLTITEASDKAIRGTFNLYFDNNYNGASRRRITGDFGIITKPD